MASYRKLGKNMLSLTIGNFASKLLSFLFVPFYTSVLTTPEYGTADLVTTTVTLLFPFFSLIICESMMRFALNKEDKSKVFQIGMCVWAAGAALLIILSPILLFISTLKDYLILVVLYYLGYSICQNIGYFCRGAEKVVLYTISGIVATVFTIGLNLLFLLWLKLGVNGYLLASIIANFSAALVMFIGGEFYKYKHTFRSVDMDLMKRMLKYSVPMIPNSASWWVSNSSDKYILIFFAGVAVNGVYSVSYKIPTIITIVTSIFATAWRISAVEEFGTETSRKFYSDVYGMYVTLTAIMASSLMLLNKPLSLFLYQKDFYQAWQFVPILLVASVFHAYCEFFGTLYTSAMKTKMLFYSTVIGAGTNIVLNLILIPKFEAIGAAMATMISYMVVWLVRMFHSSKIMKLHYNSIADVSCFILILIQMIVACMTLKYELIISATILLLVVIVRRKNIKQLTRIILRR